MKIMLAGGAGYIGSHTAISLIEAGHEVFVVDNFSNSSEEAVRRVERITGACVPVYEADCCDLTSVSMIMGKERPDSVVQMAGYKAVGESVAKPVEYYRNNLDSTLTILEAMKLNGVKSIVFSSSATVYGEENPVPYTEDMPRGRCSNPYGWTKSMIEQILEDAAKADPELSVVLLRYFNPVGAHESGLIGEDPQGIPNNLMPYITQVAVGRREKLTVFGGDYDTPDGTCRRDYIHVMDLAYGHALAVAYSADHKGSEIFNLGTGIPYSVLDMVNAFSEACGKPLNYAIGDRRAGDLQDCWADSTKALKVLGWEAKRGIREMCADSWNWQRNNPNGYLKNEDLDGDEASSEDE